MILYMQINFTKLARLTNNGPLMGLDFATLVTHSSDPTPSFPPFFSYVYAMDYFALPFKMKALIIITS